MDSTPLRCPNCRKKQPEPCPTRCGCGQSLLAARAKRAAETAPRAGMPGLAAPAGAGQTVDIGDNEW